MEAAFIDIGTPKNAVLYRGDVRYDKEDSSDRPSRRPSRRVAGCRTARSPHRAAPEDRPDDPVPGDQEPDRRQGRPADPGGVAARPVRGVDPQLSDTYGISKRLADDERKRLRRILDDIRPEGHGLIVRTAAEGASRGRAAPRRGRLVPAVGAHRRSRPIVPTRRRCCTASRTWPSGSIREEFNRDYRGVVIDDRGPLSRRCGTTSASINPELADRVEWAGDSDDPLPIFERYHVHEQIHKALDRKVWLPSGGSLIIERTEALTVIDVNTGKNVGTSNLEETVFRNNLEAAEEIARQLRLRDIGGIIVIDFIDMEIRPTGPR